MNSKWELRAKKFNSSVAVHITQQTWTDAGHTKLTVVNTRYTVL